MATPTPTFTPHSLLTVYGHMGSGADSEAFQFGIRIAEKQADGTFVPLSDLAVYGPAINGGLTSAWNGGSTAAGVPATWAKLDGYKIANIGADGKYLGAKDATGNTNPWVSGSFNGLAGTGVSSMPWFCALAVSFHTASPTKYAKHGRIYAPLAIGALTGGDPRLDSTTVATALNWGKALLTNISKPAGGATTGSTNPVRPVVASRHGAIFEINEVRVGDVIDVQRRRKRQMRENYQKSAWS